MRTANLTTPERVVAASRLISEGRVISCATPLNGRGPVHPARAGIVHLFGAAGADARARQRPGRLGGRTCSLLT